jgi:hypothetical protein
MKKIVFYLAVLISTGFYSCVDESDFDFSRLAQTTINPTLELNNIVKTEITMSDFLKIDLDSLVASAEGLSLETLSDQYGLFLNLHYYRLDTIVPENLVTNVPVSAMDFDLPPLDLPYFLTGIGFEGSFPANDTLVQRVDIPKFDDSVRFDSITFLNGSKLRLNLNHGITNTNDFEVYMLLGSKNLYNSISHKSFADTIRLTGDNATSNYVLDLSNYTLKLNRASEDSMYFEFYYKIFITSNATAIIPSQIQPTIYLNPENLSIDIAYGYWGKYDIVSRDTVLIPYFDDTMFAQTFVPNSIDLLSFKASMNVYSNIGIETAIVLNEFSSLTATGLHQNLIDNTLPDTVFDNNGALIPHQAIKIPLNQFYSNLDALEALPHKIFSSVDISFNKDRAANFLTPNDAFVSIESSMDVPIKLKINDLMYIEEVKAFNVVKEMDYLKSATLKFYIENGFPAGVSVQFLICDSNNLVFDSLLTNATTITGANVNAEGAVVSPKQQNVEIEINSSKYDALRRADKIKIRVILNTSSSESNKPYVRLNHKDPMQKLRFSLGVKAQANITF